MWLVVKHNLSKYFAAESTYPSSASNPFPTRRRALVSLEDNRLGESPTTLFRHDSREGQNTLVDHLDGIMMADSRWQLSQEA